MNIRKRILYIIFSVILGFFLTAGLVKAATTLFGYQGGTGFSTTTAGNVGSFLQVASTSPYLTYTFGSALTTTPNLQQVTNVGAITTNQIQFAGGTSTAAFTIQGLLTAPTGSFAYIDATTTNATFATIGTLTGSNATITNVSSTNMSVSSSLLVAGKAVCLVDGTNCLATSTPTLQQVATAGNTTSLALTFAGGTSTANFVVTGTFSAQTTTLGTVTAGVWNGTKVSEAYGGTNQSTYTLGDTLYASAANTLSKLPGNTATTRKFYRQTGDGANSAAPAWDTITAADIPGSALTKTDDTNVTLTLGGSPTTALLNATSLTLGWTGQLGLTRGGTGASLTASNGGMVYSTGSALAILAGTATANKVLMSGASGAPSWSVPTYPNASATAGKIIRSDGTNFLSSTSLWPDTTTINQILYSSAANTIAGITTANNGVLITSAGGVPSIGSTLPSAVQSNITSVGTLTGLTVSGLTSLASTTITGNATTTGNQVIGGTLSVTGASTFTGNVTAVGSLTVTSSVTNTLKIATNGYTQLGEIAPSIKTYFVTGTVSGSAGGCTTVTLPATIYRARIADVAGRVRWAGTDDAPAMMPFGFTIYGGYELDYYMDNGDPVNFNVCTTGTNSGNILGQLFTLYITYMQ